MSKRITRFGDLVEALAPASTPASASVRSGSRRLVARRLVAIVGPPGSGKSTLSKALADALNQRQPGTYAILPMDGFHLDDDVLRQCGRLEHKGAPDTFDVGGLVHMHRRLAANDEARIAVPLFDRARELSRAGARIIDASVATVLVEGNYLLLRQAPWDRLAAFYDVSVRIAVPFDELEARLVERWRTYGLSCQDGRRRVAANDLPNARLVVERSAPADLVYEPGTPPPPDTA